MATTLEQFRARLHDSGLMSRADLATFAEAQPACAAEEDPSSLAQALVEAERLTSFQAEALLGETAPMLRLGKYLLLEQIGQGGMGQVYKAIHERMNRIVALKILPPMAAMDAGLVARFRREVQVAAKLHHPHIVTAYDADESEGVYFLVMELVEGRDLAAVVSEDGPLSVDQVLDYIEQAATALQYAHEEGVLHRDVKPANLLVDASGHVKVLDMGLARLDTSEGLTTTGEVIGTASTMAPEQGDDIRLVDERSDVYGLGCSLFYLLAGRHMYEGDSPLQMLLAHARDPVPSLRDACAETPLGLETLFQSMVQKAREDRPANMAAVIEAIQAIRSGREPSVPEVVPSRSRRLPGRSIATIVVLATLGLLLWFVQRDGNDTPGDTPQGESVLLKTLSGHEGAVHAVAVHPDGRRVLSASSDGTVGVWELQGGTLEGRLEGHTDSVRCVLCLRDGKTVITSSDDATIRIWDLETLSTRRVLSGHENKVRQIALAPDESWLASVSKDGTLRIWDLPGGAQRLVRRGHSDGQGDKRGLLGVAVRPDGKALATTAYDKTVRLWDTQDFEVRTTLGPHGTDVGAVAYSSDGTYLLYDLQYGQVRVLRADGSNEVTRLVGHEDWVYSIASTKHGDVVATGSQDMSLKLWRLEDGSLLETLTGHTFTVTALAFTTDGATLISGSGDETVRLWDVKRFTNPDD